MAVDYALIEEIDTDPIEPIAIIPRPQPHSRPKPPIKDENFLGADGTECNWLLIFFVLGTLYIMSTN